jgi:hypothetical protein
MEVSKELMEEYLFDIFGLRFKYYNTDDYWERMDFKYEDSTIYYYDKLSKSNKYGYNSDFYLTRNVILFNKLENGDIRVWLRKKKLERVGNE